MTDVRELDVLDARWCAVEDALALGEAPEHASIEASFGAEGDEPRVDPRLQGAWARERAFYAALAREATGQGAGSGRALGAWPMHELADTMPSAEDLALVDAVLARHEGAPGHAVPATVPSQDHTVVVPLHRPSAGRWVAVVLALAAAVVLVFALRPELALRGSEGSWVAEGGQRRHGPGDELPMAVWLVAEGPACAELDDEASLCAGQGTVLRLHEGDGGRTRVEVRRGTVTVDGTLAVETTEGELRGNEASRFAVTIAGDGGAVEVEVERGALELAAPEGTRAIEPGRRVRLGDDEAPAPEPTSIPEPTPPTVQDVQEAPARAPQPAVARPSERTKPGSDPGALLVQARVRLGEGDERGAAKLYATLIETHPGSAEAQAARFSLGQLRLAGGKAKAALALFDRYLQRGGPLADEALWGRIQALSALGRQKELEAAVDRLVREQPRSVYRARAQKLTAR
jgi:hypothetical protein